MKFGTNRHVRWLLSRSYGQGGTVALPVGREQEDIRSEFPAGVQDVLNRLGDNLIEQSKKNSDTLEWCFLVGGPGNGKSEALRSLAELLNVDLPVRLRGRPSPRTVPNEWPDKAMSIPDLGNAEIVFINDASIPRNGASPTGVGSLFLDVVDAINFMVGTNRGKTLSLFGNINRGILVEEEAKLRQYDINDRSESIAAKELIEWLSNPPRDHETSALQIIETIVPVDQAAPYYGQCKINRSKIGSECNILIHVVFLDTLSLLEPRPENVNKQSINFAHTPTPSPYMTFGGFYNGRGAARETTVAGKLLSKVVQSNLWEEAEQGCLIEGQLCSAAQLCPFFQNVHWLRSINLQRRLLDFLRAAEIASSRRFTYRDLVGHISLAIIGQPEKEWLSVSHPCEWIKQKYLSIVESNKVASVAELVTHRIYSNLFPPTDLNAWKTAAVKGANGTVYSVAVNQMTSLPGGLRNRAFENAFNTIDPARSVEPWENLAKDKVIEAIESLELKDPTANLREEKLLSDDGLCNLENLLDDVVRGEISRELESSSQNSRLARDHASQRAIILRKWRNTLLLRQVGLANGWFNFMEVIGAWLSEQENALRGDVILNLGKGVERLLIPPVGDTLLFAPLRPRTYSLDHENLPPNTILFPVNARNLQVIIVPAGDNLLAEVRSQSNRKSNIGRVVASIVIDLPIAREALLQSRTSMGSFTEIGSSAFARIERVRASLVGRRELRQGSVYFTDSHGNVFRLIRNPSGDSVLTVVPR